MLTKSRMKEHYDCCLTVNEEELLIISSGTKGMYPINSEKIVERLVSSLASHERVLVVRFDVSLTTKTLV